MFIRTRSGISIKEFITEYLNAESDYISKRISTLFLNGTPVDDLDYEILTDGSVLALSAAMPGLAGAILRKGGHLAGLRTRVEKKHSAEKAASGAWVKLKLFNALVPELGPGLLSRGIWVKASSISSFPAESNILPPYTDPDNPDEMVHVIVKAV
ncbi:MAG: hypothetical protein C4582_08805 [Desulfobacteraceae bacterium]|nr:MAG: hypothetical protein C4582_08805 [Desulfobacteraceae bacterium]